MTRIDWHADPPPPSGEELDEPASILRLLKRKERLTLRLMKLDMRAGRHGRLKPRTLLRAKIYKTDRRLEKHGLL